MKPYYESLAATLYLGDCLEVMKTFRPGSADAIVTDPPFAFAGGISNGLSSRADDQFFSHWLVSVFEQFYRVSRPSAVWFIWADWRTATVYDAALQKAAPDYHDARWVSQVLIHDRAMIGMGSPFRNQTDWIAVIRGKKTDFGARIPKETPNIIRDYWYYGKHAHHPSEKSVGIARRLVEWATDTGGVVFDPFAGGGSIGVATVEAGRRYIGVERDAEYVETAKRRIAAGENQPALFAATETALAGEAS
jgi:site-specific DNA-methyltransferase (adenine-specific)